jgi:hypothetical protein
MVTDPLYTERLIHPTFGDTISLGKSVVALSQKLFIILDFLISKKRRYLTTRLIFFKSVQRAKTQRIVTTAI